MNTAISSLSATDTDRFVAAWDTLRKGDQRVLANRNSDGHVVFFVSAGPERITLKTLDELEAYVQAALLSSMAAP